MNWKDGRQLQGDQRCDPIVWRVCYYGIALPSSIISRELTSAFAPGRAKTLKTWGRNPEDRNGPHWIGVRNGTPLHTDPRYPRYTHQLVVHNSGWYVGGILRDVAGDPFGSGTLFCLDTHSPHILLPDSRVGVGAYYLAISIDAPTPLLAAEVIRGISQFARDVR